jgi:hypothetical protein
LKAYLPGQAIEVTLQSGGDIVTRKITLIEAK